jgi:hypothetical protein
MDHDQSREQYEPVLPTVLRRRLKVIMTTEPQLEKNPGFWKDLVAFLIENKKWWLLPVVIVMLLVGGLIMLGSTAAAPFIYTLF